MQESKNKTVQFQIDHLSGSPVEKTRRKFSDLSGVFYDKEAFNSIPQENTSYEVECYFPVENGTEGGLFFGITHLYPGLIGDEYNMTKGHFHAKRNRGEFYWGIAGEGRLILMDADRNVRTEHMFPGSLHYIPGYVAHRVANTGREKLTFGACWPSDAGHDYDTILEKGFEKRLVSKNGKPTLIDSKG